MLQRGVSPELARQWIETCYPAQIRLVLDNPEWSKYSGDELAKMGIRGIRGRRASFNRKLKQQAAEEHATRVRRNKRLRQLRKRKSKGAKQQQEKAQTEILDEFL